MGKLDFLNTGKEEKLGNKEIKNIEIDKLNKKIGLIDSILEKNIKVYEDTDISQNTKIKKLKQELNDNISMVNNSSFSESFKKLAHKNIEDIINQIDVEILRAITNIENRKIEIDKKEKGIKENISKNNTGSLDDKALGINGSKEKNIDKQKQDTEKVLKNINLNGIKITELETIETYLLLKGKDNTPIYKILNGTILKNIKSSPKLLGYGIYQNFIKDYILKPIKNGNFSIEKNSKYNSSVEKLNKVTSSVLHEFQNELASSNVENVWAGGEAFVKMENQREKITELKKLTLNDLLTKNNINKFNKLDFEGTRDDIKKGIEEFRKNSQNSEGRDYADMLSDKKIQEMTEALENAESVFNELKIQLNYIYSYIGDKGIDNLTTEEKSSLENDIKGIVSMMYFINGLDTDYFDTLSSLSIPVILTKEAYEYGVVNGVLVGSAFALVLLGEFTYRHAKSIIAKKQFFKLIDNSKLDVKEGTGETEATTKKEKFKNLFKTKDLNTLDAKELSSLIEEMETEGEDGNKILKDKYEKLEGVYERLKKFKKLKDIVDSMSDFKGVKLDVNSVFLPDQMFARESLRQLFRLSTFSKDISGIKRTGNFSSSFIVKYLGLGVGEKLANLFGTTQFTRFGTSSEGFGKIFASSTLEAFTSKFHGIVEVSKNLKLLKNEGSIHSSKRSEIVKTINEIKKELLNAGSDVNSRFLNNGKIDNGLIQSYIVGELNSKLGLLINSSNLDKKYFEKLKSIDEAELKEVEKLKDSIKKIEGELPKDIKIDASYSQLLDKTKLDNIKSKYEKVLEIFEKIDSSDKYYKEVKDATKDFLTKNNSVVKLDEILKEIPELDKIKTTGETFIDSQIENKVKSALKNSGDEVISNIINNQSQINKVLNSTKGNSNLDKIVREELKILYFDGKIDSDFKGKIDNYIKYETIISTSKIKDIKNIDLKTEVATFNQINSLVGKVDTFIENAKEEAIKLEKEADRKNQLDIAKETSKSNGSGTIINNYIPESNNNPSSNGTTEAPDNMTNNALNEYKDKVNLLLEIFGKNKVGENGTNPGNSKEEILNRAGIKNFDLFYKHFDRIDNIFNTNNNIGPKKLRRIISGGEFTEKEFNAIEAQEKGLVKDLIKIGKQLSIEGSDLNFPATEEEIKHKTEHVRKLYERGIRQADLLFKYDLSNKIAKNYTSLDIKNINLSELRVNLSKTFEGGLKSTKELVKLEKIINKGLVDDGILEKTDDGYKLKTGIDENNLSEELKKINNPDAGDYVKKLIKKAII